MIIEVDLDFMVANKMTIEQYFVCYVLHEDKRTLINGERGSRKSGQPIASIYRYSENVGGLKRPAMEDLVERGYLKKVGDKLTPDMLEVQPKFAQAVFNHWTNFDQLFELYPNRARFEAGGQQYFLKSLDKPKEELAKYYEKIVRTNKKHREILDITKWAKNHNMLKTGIQKYVYSQLWELLSEDYETGGEDESYEVMI